VTDQNKLEQCLLNLLSNAAKFTEDGEITLRAYSGINNQSERMLYFEVIDTGVGMSAEVQKTIFEAFTQADSSTTRQYGGTGLGLAITKSFCEMLHGQITVESEIGQGSRFIMALPSELAPRQELAAFKTNHPFPS
jgi:signal transduction histidine kinase